MDYITRVPMPALVRSRAVELRALRRGGGFRLCDRVPEGGGQREGVAYVAEGHELVELPERVRRDLLLLVCMPAERCEHADRLRPCEHCATEAVQSIREGELPCEGAVVCVDHREVSVEAVDGVSDEGAGLGADQCAADGVEDYEAVHELWVWHLKHAHGESLHSIPEGGLGRGW